MVWPHLAQVDKVVSQGNPVRLFVPAVNLHAARAYGGAYVRGSLVRV